jgi:N-acetyl-gamma-glutamyl-phosphate reductase
MPFLKEPLADHWVHPFQADEVRQRCDLLFTALPHGVAMTLAAKLLKGSRLIWIDLSGDFRLKSASVFRQAYGKPHASPSWLRKAVYGLTEWNRKALKTAQLVANPGCYPTAALLALAPLAAEGWLDPDCPIRIDAKSGATGAGRSLREDLLFSEVNEDLRAYKVDAHPHTPEMIEGLKALGQKRVSVTFVPHLVPIDRGIYATIYVQLKRVAFCEEIRRLYEKRYGAEAFVRWLPKGVWPQVKAVVGTNECHLNLHMAQRDRSVILLAALDNLMKGAAGQAVQNMNLIFGWPESTGLN